MSAPTFANFQFENAALRPLVRAAWVQSYSETPPTLPGMIAPDGHVEVVLQLGAPCDLLLGERSHSTPRAMVYGLRHGALQLRPTGPNTMVAFRLAPAVASAVFGACLVDCWDRPVPLSDLIGAAADDLFDLIANTPPKLIGSTLESWLISRLANWSSDDARQLALQTVLFWNFTDQRVSKLAEELGFTARTLRRHCEAYAGLSPKQIAMSGRVLRACHLLRTSQMPIAQIADVIGFNDQSAFTGAFRHYLGMTPAQLRAQQLVFYEAPS